MEGTKCYHTLANTHLYSVVLPGNNDTHDMLSALREGKGEGDFNEVMHEPCLLHGETTYTVNL